MQGLGLYGPGLSTQQWFDVLGTRIDGELAGREREVVRVDVEVTDRSEHWALILSNGVLTSRRLRESRVTDNERKTDAVIRLSRQALNKVLAGDRSAGVEFEVAGGEVQPLNQILSYASIPELPSRTTSRL